MSKIKLIYLHFPLELLNIHAIKGPDILIRSSVSRCRGNYGNAAITAQTFAALTETSFSSHSASGENVEEGARGAAAAAAAAGRRVVTLDGREPAGAGGFCGPLKGPLAPLLLPSPCCVRPRGLDGLQP